MTLDGSCPGHAALLCAALWSCATQSAPRRSAASGTRKAPAPLSFPAAFVSYSPSAPFLHLIATRRPERKYIYKSHLIYSLLLYSMKIGSLPFLKKNNGKSNKIGRLY
uniref:Uncharacterized protein n=1 Tax=Oryza glumipatula TaxID=40148 RepID=A0A0E0B7W8_9ORYZ